MGYFYTGDGFVRGLNQGREEGRTAGWDDGYREGRADGYQDGRGAGWDDAVNHCNEEMVKQMAYTREHLAAKESLSAQLDEARAVLQLAAERIDALELELSQLKAALPGGA